MDSPGIHDRLSLSEVMSVLLKCLENVLHYWIVILHNYCNLLKPLFNIVIDRFKKF